MPSYLFWTTSNGMKQRRRACLGFGSRSVVVAWTFPAIGADSNFGAKATQLPCPAPSLGLPAGNHRAWVSAYDFCQGRCPSGGAQLTRPANCFRIFTSYWKDGNSEYVVTDVRKR
jgi:hypothetical protein